MTIEEVHKLKEGDTLFWAVGKKYYKGKFLSLNEDVLDLKTLQVEDESGQRDEILHAFIVSEEKYLMETSPKTFKPTFVQNKIQKSEDLNDEESVSDEIAENVELEVEIEVEKPKPKDTKIITNKTIVVSQTVNPVSVSLSAVNSPRGNNNELKPNLKSLQILLQKDGYFIERNENRWVEYFLYLPDGEKLSFICKLKVWQLYNIYIEKGIQGLIDLA